MIDLNFGLYWVGPNFSYLRYLSLKSLRHFHPNAKIHLYLGQNYDKKNYNWNREKQDFEQDLDNYICLVNELDVEIIKIDAFSKYPPNYQSDFFRYWYMFHNGGFYLDIDQIIVKSFETLPLNTRMIYCQYMNPQCGLYTPVGVLGMDKGSSIAKHMMDVIPRYYNSNNYNSIGPFMFIKEIQKVDMSNTFKAPKEYFYPVFHSDMVVDIYSGKMKLSEGEADEYNEVYSVHWFGGHPLSQKFNKKFTKEFARESDDSISVFIRKMGWI